MAAFREILKDEQFRRGVREMLPFTPGMAAWGLVTGVAMVKGGLGVPLAVFMSLTVYAGSAQLVSVPLIASGAPEVVVWAAALCVNLRFMLFSAQWRVVFDHLPRAKRVALVYLAADINMLVFQKAWPEPRAQPGQVPYFLGGAATVWLSWQLASFTGIALAEVIPERWGLGFAGTLAMLGLAYGLVSDRITAVAAVVAGAAAVAAFALPLKLNIVLAIASGMAAFSLMQAANRSRRVEEPLA